MAHANFETAKELFATRLRGLSAAGIDGFEGLMRDVLTEVTGQSYRLAKSGPQGGSDVRSEPTNAIRIGLEGKKYGAETTLPLDQLKAKVVDAAGQVDPVDLWILAATREITATDVEALVATGEKHGITVLVLDWPAQPGVLSDLAVLCVTASTACKRHLGNDQPMLDAILEISNHANFQHAQERLREWLHRADIGYAAAVAALSHWMIDAQGTEANARSRLGGFNNLLQEGVNAVPRPTQLNALDAWWGNCTKAAVLVGDEGLGKTWSVLSWWHARQKAGKALPLTLFVSAREVGDEDVETLVARLLARRTRLRDEAFWLKRLLQWQKCEVKEPQVLLVIDGLDQNWLKKDWSNLLQPLYDTEWQGRFAVLLTCWPDHWDELHHLSPLAPEPIDIRVLPFDDAELDALLDLHGYKRADFSPAILELMKVPRLSLLALELRKELVESGDVTPERLAYEDWKHRVSRKGVGIGISDDEFKTFVAQIGKELQTSIEAPIFSRKELFDNLGKDSGKARDDLLSTVGELIAGRWFEAGKRPNQFRVNKNLIPFALGITLAAELRDTFDESSASTRIADFLDPLKAQSLGVAVLRAATTAALLDPAITRPARRAIIRRWLLEQNFSQVDFDAYWKMIGLDTALICDLVEEFWLDPNSGGFFTDEIIIRGFANAYQFTEVAKYLVERVTSWLGWCWPDPDSGRFLGRVDPLSERSQANQSRTLSNMESWQTAEVGGNWPRTELKKSGDVSWFSHRVFGILSFLPREPFTKALVAWGISRAIMGIPRHFEELAWVLRLNRIDPDTSRAKLWESIDALSKEHHGVAQCTAGWLLEALADNDSTVRLSAMLNDYVSDAFFLAQPVKTVLTDPLLNPIAALPLEPASKSPLLTGDKLWLFPRQVGDVDINHQREVPNLARNAPDQLRSLVGHAALSAPEREVGALRGLVEHLAEFMMVLTAEERQTVADTISKLLDTGTIVDPQELQFWRSRLLLIEIWGRSAEEQFEILLAKGMDATLLVEVQKLLEQPRPGSFKALLSRLPLGGSQNEILGSLHYVIETGNADELKEWDALATFMFHEDIGVRNCVFRLTCMGKNEAALKALAASDWAYQKTENREESLYGSLAMVNAATALGNEQLCARAEPEVVALRIRDCPDDPQAIIAYNSYLRRAIEGSSKRGTVTLPAYRMDHRKSVELLLQKDRDALLAWLDPWLGINETLPHFALFEEFPFLVLCKALLKEKLQQGVIIWRRLRAAMAEGIVKPDELLFMPLLMPEVDQNDELLEEMLDNAVTDLDLFKLTHRALKRNKGTWLEAIIRRDEKSGEPDKIARAYILLGYVDEAPNFETLWTEFNSRHPMGGWLKNVYGHARHEYERNTWARYWHRKYIEANNSVDAFAAYQLMTKCIDARAGIWMREQFNDAPRNQDLEWRAHWRTNAERLNRLIKDHKSSLKDQLYGTRTMARTQSPWL